MPVTLYADRNIYHLKDWLPGDVNLITFEPSNGLPDLSDADALIVRTVSKINAETLKTIPKSLRFVGTASAGTDHIDIDYLEDHGVRFVSAAGCNARAVAEYIGTSLIIWADQTGIKLHDRTIGIVGVGHVGSELVDLLDEMQVPYVTYDPPREERESDFTSAALDEVLDCEILTFHVPLTETGDYATHHWLDAEKLSGHSYELVINASRGGVIDEEALIDAINSGHVKNSVIDVWENEPAFNPEMLPMSILATPHIAGYSVQAKDNATRMMMKPLADTFQLKWENNISSSDSPLTLSDSNDASLSSLLESINPILSYDNELRSVAGLPDDERAAAFRKMRTDRPFREEYRMFTASEELCKKHPYLVALGIHRKGSPP